MKRRDLMVVLFLMQPVLLILNVFIESKEYKLLMLLYFIFHFYMIFKSNEGEEENEERIRRK